MKDWLRWELGTFTKSIGATEMARKVYFGLAKSFVSKLPKDSVDSVWIRRSVTNQDFLPFVSDIDLTILINDRDFRSFKLGTALKRPKLIQDIQFVSKRFFPAWLETGGYRNYQTSSWTQIFGIPRQLSSPQSSREERSFETAYEVHLVFKQIALKLADENLNQKDLQKLSQELNRLKLFWNSSDSSWALAPRKNVPRVDGLKETFRLLEDICASLIDDLDPPLNVYDWRRTIIREDEFGYETAISFKGYPIFVIKDFDTIDKIVEIKRGRFLVTASYLRMIKGIGIQEQDHLNRLAKENLYYRKFSCQRLANDLIGALILEPDNIEQMYFCFYNISQFYQAISGEFPAQWPRIQEAWNKSRTLPFNNSELEAACVSYLDHLEALI